MVILWELIWSQIKSEKNREVLSNEDQQTGTSEPDVQSDTDKLVLAVNSQSLILP